MGARKGEGVGFGKVVALSMAPLDASTCTTKTTPSGVIQGIK